MDFDVKIIIGKSPKHSGSPSIFGINLSLKIVFGESDAASLSFIEVIATRNSKCQSLIENVSFDCEDVALMRLYDDIMAEGSQVNSSWY